MFCDETKITVKAGDGGNGLVSFRRMRFSPKGGPDGGNGGQGGSVVFEGNENLNTLGELNSRKFFHAENGVAGGNNDKNGRGGEDLILEVPLGTKIFAVDKKGRKGRELFDITFHKMQAVAALGGRGGYGNAHFTSSIRQAPRFAEKGEPGEELELILELEMIADAAIIGYPSAGKSTLISVISAARPKIGNYPFTTLVPNLGVVKMKQFGGSDDQDFVVADIPGLIAGAHEGKGLGDQFLRHIKRTAVLIHLVDVSREDFVAGYAVINDELQLFDAALLQREQIVVLSKIDSLSEEELEEKKAEFLQAYPFLKGKLFQISSMQQKGLKELMFTISEAVKISRSKIQAEKAEKIEVDMGKIRVFRPHLEDDQFIAVELAEEKKYLDQFTHEFVLRKCFRISGRRLEQIVRMSDTNNEEAVARIFDVLSKKGVNKELVKLGAQPGDRLLIADADLEWAGE